MKKTDDAKGGRFAKTPTATQPNLPLLTTMPPPGNQQRRPAGQQPTPSTSNVYNMQPTPNVPTVPVGASGTSMGAVPKAAERFRARTVVMPPRQEHRQGDQTRLPGGERFGYREQRQVPVTDVYGLGNRLPVTDAFRAGRLMQATKRFTQVAAIQQPRSTKNTYSQEQTVPCQECQILGHNRTMSEEDHQHLHPQHQHWYLMTKKKTQTTIYHQTRTRILMESPLLEETGTQPQDTMQEDNNATEKECIHNGEEEEGMTTGKCHQIQNND
jgi:hypothetical protein